MIILLIGLIAVFILVLVIMTSLRSGSRNEEDDYDAKYLEPVLRNDYLSGDYDNAYGEDGDGSYYIKIAGITFHCTARNIGCFIGTVANEPDNSVNPDAMAIYTQRGKLLGYVPEDDLDEYREWCNGEKRACIGYIAKEDGKLFGRVKVLPNDTDEASKIMIDYAVWLVKHRGVGFAPKALAGKDATELQTVADWVDYLKKMK